MEEIVKVFCEKKWGAPSILFGLFLPGFYQIAINNYEYFLSVSVAKSVTLALVISASTYLLLVLGTVVLQTFLKIFYVLVFNGRYKENKFSYAYIIGFINIIIVFPTTRYDVEKDVPLKYLFDFLVDTELLIVVAVAFVTVSIFALFVKSKTEKITIY